MTNLVEITVRATDDTSAGFSAIRAKAAKAGAAAADAFNTAFKLKADAGVSTKDRLESTGSLAGNDKELLNKLKGYANTPGGIGILGTGNDTSLVSMLRRQIQSAGEAGGLGLIGGSSQSGKSLQDTIRQQITGNSPGNINTTDLIRQVIQGSGPGNYNTSDFIKQVLQGNTPGNVNTTDLIRQVIEGNSPGNVSTEDIIRRVVEGSLPGNISTTDTIHERIDDSTIKAQGEKDGKTYGGGFADALKNALDGVLGAVGRGLGSAAGGAAGSGLGGLLGGAGGGEASAADSGVAGGALPGIPGISALQATIIGLAGLMAALLPSITAVAGGLAALGGGFAILETTSKSFAADMTKDMGTIEKVFENAVQPLAKPMEQAVAQIAGYFKTLEPTFKSVFADSAQLLQPLVKGFEELTSGMLPGFLAMIKAAGPVFQTLSGAFADLGKSLGEMFSDFAQAEGPSAIVLKAVLDLINTLLPVLGKLGEVFASALAPAVTAFGSAIDKVLPALEPLFSILAKFAGAVLTDLASVLGALGTLLVDLAPSFTTLAKVASDLFNTLENTGFFAILADALESLAKPLAGLINALVQGLAPILPPLITAFGKIAGVITQGLVTIFANLATALTNLIKGIKPDVLTNLVNAIVKIANSLTQAVVSAAVQISNALIKLLVASTPAILGVITGVAGALADIAADVTPVVAGTISGIASALTAIVKNIPSGFFEALAIAFLACAAAVRVWAVAQAALDLASDANPWLVIGAAVIVLAGVIIKYHAQIESAIKTAWDAIKLYLSETWSSIETLAGSLADFFTSWGSAISRQWTGTWNDVENAAKTVWDSITGFLKGVWSGIESAASTTWTTIENTAKTAWGKVYTGVQNQWSTIVGYFKGVPHAILTQLSGLGDDLNSFAKNAMNLFLEGCKSVMGSIQSFFESLPKDILSWLGIHSPPDWAISAGEFIVDGITGGMAKAKSRAAAAAKAVAAAASSGATSGPGGGAPAANAALAQKLYASQLTPSVWAAWNNVAMAESGWNQFADNPSSGAYGIPQALPFSKMPKAAWPASAGGSSNPTAQIEWMWDYMASTYGGPIGAWQHEQEFHWYGAGGPVAAGWGIVGDQGRELIKLPGGSTVMPHGATEAALSGGGGAVSISLEIGSSGSQGFDAFLLQWLRNNVRIKGGGNVQAAFGEEQLMAWTLPQNNVTQGASGHLQDHDDIYGDLAALTPVVTASGDTSGAVDLAAIQGWLNAGHHQVVLQAGVYWINAPIVMQSSSQELRGTGGATASGNDAGQFLGTTIRMTSTFSTSLVSDGPASNAGIMLLPPTPGSAGVTYGLRIRDLWVDGTDAPASTDGISVFGDISSYQFERVGVYKATGNGFAEYTDSGASESPDGGHYYSCVAQTCGGIGFYGKFDDGCCVDCHAQSCTGDGWQILSGNSRFIACRADLSANGFTVNAPRSTPPQQFHDSVTLIGCGTQANAGNGLNVINSSASGQGLRCPVIATGCSFDGDGVNGGSGGGGHAGIMVAGRNTVFIDNCAVNVMTYNTSAAPEYGLATASSGTGPGVPDIVTMNGGFLNAVTAATHDGAPTVSGCFRIGTNVMYYQGGEYGSQATTAAQPSPGPTATPVGSTPTNPGTVTSTSLVLLGLGTTATGTAWQFTPLSSGYCLVAVSGALQNPVTLAAATYGARYGRAYGPAAGTTVASGSNGGEISGIASWSSPSAGVLDVASTSGYPASGTLWVAASSSTVGQITYTGISGNSFTGCAYVQGSATGTIATGGIVTGAPQFGAVAASVGFRYGSAADFVVLGTAAGKDTPFAVFAMLSLSANDQYWFDLALDTSNGSDAVEIHECSFSAMETS